MEEEVSALGDGAHGAPLDAVLGEVPGGLQRRVSTITAYRNNRVRPFSDAERELAILGYVRSGQIAFQLLPIVVADRSANSYRLLVRDARPPRVPLLEDSRWRLFFMTAAQYTDGEWMKAFRKRLRAVHEEMDNWTVKKLRRPAGKLTVEDTTFFLGNAVHMFLQVEPRLRDAIRENPVEMLDDPSHAEWSFDASMIPVTKVGRYADEKAEDAPQSLPMKARGPPRCPHCGRLEVPSTQCSKLGGYHLFKTSPSVAAVPSPRRRRTTLSDESLLFRSAQEKLVEELRGSVVREVKETLRRKLAEDVLREAHRYSREERLLHPCECSREVDAKELISMARDSSRPWTPAHVQWYLRLCDEQPTYNTVLARPATLHSPSSPTKPKGTIPSPPLLSVTSPKSVLAQVRERDNASLCNIGWAEECAEDCPPSPLDFGAALRMAVEGASSPSSPTQTGPSPPTKLPGTAAEESLPVLSVGKEGVRHSISSAVRTAQPMTKTRAVSQHKKKRRAYRMLREHPSDGPPPPPLWAVHNPPRTTRNGHRVTGRALAASTSPPHRPAPDLRPLVSPLCPPRARTAPAVTPCSPVGDIQLTLDSPPSPLRGFAITPSSPPSFFSK